MAFERSLDDYVDVATRIADFRERYPEGTLRPWIRDEPYKIVQAQGIDRNGEVVQQTFIVVVAAAYRDRDDFDPGVGMAWEVFPGRTNFTRGSELQNAETSAWGRAIIAVGASDSKRGIASREEVRNRQAERDDGLPVNRDGSLSRSRTTDEEKDRAGVMTSAQQAEHTALQPKRAEVTQGLAAAAGVEDRWTIQSDGTNEWGPGSVSEIDQDTPGTITRQQQTAMHAAFGVLGMTDREERLAYTEKLLGLDQPDSIASSSDLSYRQAGTLLEKLEQRQREGTRA